MKGITKLQDGLKGVVFKIVNDDNTEQVIKLQADNPAKAIVSSNMMQSVGVYAPKTEAIRGQGMTDFQQEVAEFIQQAKLNEDPESEQIAQQLSECLRKASDPKSKYTFNQVVRMDYASGETLGTALKNGAEFKKLMTNPQFQRQLGQMMAADTLTGNGDRVMAVPDGSLVEGKLHNETGSAPKLTAFYNPGNLVIEKNGEQIKLKGIDNDLLPGMNTTGQSQFGKHVDWLQFSGVATADPQQFKREIFAIAERWEKSGGFTLTPQELKDFVEVTTQSAKETIDFAVSSDSGITPEGIAQQLEENGESHESAGSLASSYGQHQQLLKMMSGALHSGSSIKPSVREMLGLAKQGHSDEIAKELLNSPEARKAVVGMNKSQLGRFNKLMAGERGSHVPKDFKITVKEAALMAKDESVYKQFTHKAKSLKI